MTQSPFTLSGVFQRNDSYYTGHGTWADVESAQLYSPEKAGSLNGTNGLKDKAIRLVYVIQNYELSYYDGASWVYSLSEALLYRLEDAEAAMRLLNAAA